MGIIINGSVWEVRSKMKENHTASISNPSDLVEDLVGEYIRQSYPAYIFERSYVTNCLGINIPLNESYPYSSALEKQIIQEHLLMESFFGDLKALSGQAKKFGEALKEIFKNPDKIGSFIAAVNKMVLKKMVTPIKNFFKMVKDKLADIGGEIFPTFIKAAENILAGIDKILETVQGLDGWKKAIGIIALSLGIKWIWEKAGKLIEEGTEKLQEILPAIEVVIAAGSAVKAGLDEAEEDAVNI